MLKMSLKWPLFCVCILTVTMEVESVDIVYTNTNANLVAIPTDIQLNTNQIFLSNNKLSSTTGLPTLMNLTILELDFNEFEEFPDLSKVSVSLVYILLKENNIPTIDPARLDILTSLEELNMQNNRLTSFPDVRGPANTLQILKLSGNSLVEFPVLTQLGAHGLHTLYLDNNDLVTVQNEALRALPSMQQLMLSRNQISEFPSTEIGDFMPQLSHLWLGQNNIPDIASDFFQRMPNLRYFSMSYTNIKTIPAVCYKDGPRKEMKLSHTSLKCDCQLKPVIVAKDMGKADFGLTACSEPDHLSGRLISSLTLHDLDCTNSTGIFQETFFIADGGFDCGHPNMTQRIDGVSHISCAALCVNNRHCYAYGFESAMPGHMTSGACGISEHGENAATGIQWEDFTYKFTEL